MAKIFTYNYSADRNDELQNFKRKYQPQTNDKNSKLEQIRRLDSKIEIPSKFAGIMWGLVSFCLFGRGFSWCILMISFNRLFIGILLSIVGIAGMATAPKISKIVFNQRKEKYSAEILRLINETENNVHEI